MCELLVFLTDKASDPDPAINLTYMKRGYVIVVCEDGWQWSQAELTNPDWVVVQVPGVPVSEYNKFQVVHWASYTNYETGEQGVMDACRALMLDIDQDPVLREISTRGDVQVVVRSPEDIAVMETAVLPPTSSPA